jgi:hypothetical protein
MEKKSAKRVLMVGRSDVVRAGPFAGEAGRRPAAVVR